MENKLVLEVNNLSKSFYDHKVLDNISFSIKEGEIFGYIGSNGIGKSTTIKCITSIIPYEGGSISINGYNIKKDELNAKLSFSLSDDESSLYSFMTPKEYLSFIASLYKVDDETFKKRYDYYIERFTLKKDEDNLIYNFSRGMKQKVSLMAALIHEPKLWILDEPLVGLDINMLEVLLEEMKYFKERGNSILLTSHNIDIVEKICDKVVFLNNGRLSDVFDMNSFKKENKSLTDEFRRLYR